MYTSRLLHVHGYCTHANIALARMCSPRVFGNEEGTLPWVCACAHSIFAATRFNSSTIVWLVFLSTSSVTFCPSPAVVWVPHITLQLHTVGFPCPNNHGHTEPPPPIQQRQGCTVVGWHSPKNTLTKGVGLTFLNVRNCTLGFLYWSCGTLADTKYLHKTATRAVAAINVACGS